MQFNRFQYNQSQYNAPAPAASVAAHRVRKYLLQVREPDGDLLWNVPRFLAGVWAQEVNRPDTLTFTVQGDEDCVDDLGVNNEVWLYTSPEATDPSQKFRIARVETEREMGYEVRVQCFSLVDKLRDDVIIDYDANTTAAAHIAAWLGSTYQNGTYKIALGGMQSSLASTTVNMSLQGVSIYQALERLQEAIGGEYWVSPERRLYWYNQMGVSTGQQIRYKKNLVGITKTVDRSGLATRVYAYGAGNTKGTQIALAAPGYVQQNTGTYGVVSRVFNLREIQDQATLTTFANKALGLLSEPQTTYECNALDLSHHQTLDFSFDTVALGNRYRVIDEVAGVDALLSAVRVERNLSDPMRVRVALTKRQMTVDQLIRDLMERLETVEEREVVFNETMVAEVVGTSGEGSPGDSGRALHDNAKIPIDLNSIASALASGASATINKWVPYDGE